MADSLSGSEAESTHSEAGSLIPKEFEITPNRGLCQSLNADNKKSFLSPASNFHV